MRLTSITTTTMKRILIPLKTMRTSKRIQRAAKKMMVTTLGIRTISRTKKKTMMSPSKRIVTKTKIKMTNIPSTFGNLR